MKLSDAAFATLRSCLRELADPDFQQRVWVRGEGTEESGPSEVVSQLFDDTGLGDLLERSKRPVVSKEADPVLRELGSRIEKVDLRTDVRELLDQQQWRRIRALAAKAAILVDSAGDE